MTSPSTVRLSDYEDIATTITPYISGIPPLETAVVVDAIREGKIALPAALKSGGSPEGKREPEADKAASLPLADIAQRYRASLPESDVEATKQVRLDAGRILRLKDVDLADRRSADLRTKAAQLIREADAADAEVAATFRRIEQAEREIERIEVALENFRSRDFDAEEANAEAFIESTMCKNPLDRSSAETFDLAAYLRLLTELPFLRRITTRAITRLDGELKEAKAKLKQLRGPSKNTNQSPEEDLARELQADLH